MALARSASGPGGLSINTSSANNLFGQSSNQAPAAGGGLFGAQPAQSTNTSSLFGNTGAAASTPKTGGLFGSTAAAPSQPQQTGGGLFGNTGTQQQAGGGGGGLFGGAGNTQQQPAQQTGGGGLFGGTGTAQQQPAQQTGGGLFGGASNNTAQPQQSGGLFGGANNANTQAQQPAGGLFGGAPAQTQNQGQASGGLFGGSSFGKPQQQQQQQPQQGSSLFGQPNQQKPGLFGNTINGQQSTMGSIPGLTMGQGQSQPTAPGGRIEIRGTTRFNDLPEDHQKSILEADKRIQTFMTQKAELDAFMPGHGEMLSYIPDDVKFVERKYGGVQSALESDAEAIEGVRLCVEQDAANAKLSFRAVDNLKLPAQYHTGGLWSTRQQSTSTANTETDGQGLVGFFNRTADEMDSQLKVYEKQLTEIEMHMRGVQDNVLERLQQMMASKNNGPSPADQQLADLGAVLRDFEMGILRVAGDVGAAKEGMARLQLGEFMNASEQ